MYNYQIIGTISPYTWLISIILTIIAIWFMFKYPNQMNATNILLVVIAFLIMFKFPPPKKEEF